MPQMEYARRRESEALPRTGFTVVNADGLARVPTQQYAIYGSKGIDKPNLESTEVVVIGTERTSNGTHRLVAFDITTGITLRELAAATKMDAGCVLRCLSEGAQTLWGGMDEGTRANLNTRGARVRFQDISPYVLISLGRDRLEEKARIQSV
ncbi:MAG: hypothetical protein G01um10145_33 [Microgenomates group bacterium Gr01-1014_5]|nr:MAG: hypothetical protein G01um10145_33 [Microgenomates group bacterium Gr01-1014_5]